MRTLRILLLALVTSLNVGTIALSLQQTNHQQVNRKDFLGKLATSSLAIGGLVATKPEKSFAASINDNTHHQSLYEPSVGSQNGKVHLITGASTGLGLESAKRIAAAGATVVLTSRTTAKGERAVQEIQDYLSTKKLVQNPNVYFLTLDLDDFESVRSFPDRYNSLTSNKRIDVLMNNAGVAAIPTREVTKDGFERTFQSNHLGPFVLTALLFPYLNRKGARIINVSSKAHSLATNFDLNNLNSEKCYDHAGWGAYGQSKLENILFTQELQRRADSNGLDWLTVTCLHPGVVGTDIWRTTPLVGKTSSSFTSNLFYSRMLTIEEGSNTQIYLATEDKKLLSKGQYYNENGKIQELEKFAQDPVMAQGLWSASERLSGVDFKVL